MTTEDKSILSVVYQCNSCKAIEIGDTVSETGSKNCQSCGAILSLYRPPKDASDISKKPWNKAFEALLSSKGK